ncbi:MAG: hypothetical protein WCV58_04125 [Patescibacteria group bacterium]
MTTRISFGTKREYLLKSRKIDLETSHFSSCRAMMEHPSFEEIVGLGKDAIVLMLRDIKRSLEIGIHWRFMAICKIAMNENIKPVEIPEKSAGRVEQMRRLYLVWGRKHGFV